MTVVTLDAILETAHRIRSATEAHAVRLGLPSNLRGMCAVASEALTIALCEIGVAARFVGGVYRGEGHCWVEIAMPDGPSLIVDITATQFGAHPPVRVVQVTDMAAEDYRSMLFGATALDHLRARLLEQREISEKLTSNWWRT